MSHHHQPHTHPSGTHRVAGFASLAPARREVHRLGRRRFLADLGKGTFAVAVLGAAAACSSSDSASGGTTGDSDPEDESIGSGSDAGSGLEWAQVSLGFVSAYVLSRGSEAAVVDTGVPGSASQIGDTLATLGFGWGDVDHVILTHHHGDHVGGLNEVLAEVPNATAYAGEADIANIQSTNPLTAVGDGDEILGLQVLHTPGHTPGSISLLDPGIGLLVAGDAVLANDAGTEVLAPSDRFSEDIDLAFRSVKDLAELNVASVLPGHGQPVDGEAGALLSALAESL